MSTPTPRTDAAWTSSFEGKQLSAGQTAWALRECSQQLERELAALTAERDQLRAEVANMHQTFAGNVHTDNRQLRAEVERYRLVTLKQDPELTAEREKAERYRLVTLRQHLAIERGRLDWLLSYDGVDWILSAHKNRKLFEGESDNRALLEAAMKEGAK